MRLVALLLVVSFALLPALVSGQTTEIAGIEEGSNARLLWTGLKAPVDVVLGPDGTLYYAEFMTGQLRAIPPGANAPLEEPLWIAPDLATGGERGLVGLALAPDFANSRAFYVNYQTNKSGEIVTRLSRVIDGEETVLIDDLRSELLHNSGRLAFMPDGTLLMSVGDATLDTIGRAASDHAHDPGDLHGKILRLTQEGTPAPGNPWHNEVWTKGHRNVYGLAVSPDGLVIATENGPDHWDEINVLEAGADFGWPTCAGPCGKREYAEPVLAYYDTIAPTGAVWYDGAFYFSDFNKGRVHRIYPLANGTWADERVLKFTTPRILDIAAGPDRLYVSTWDSLWEVTVPPMPTGTAPSSPIGEPTEAVRPTPTPSSLAQAAPPDPAAAAGGAGVPGPGVWAVALVAAAAWISGRKSVL